MSKENLGKVFTIVLPILFSLSLLLPVVSTEVFAQAQDRPVVNTNPGNTDRPVVNTNTTQTCVGNECRLDNPFTVSSVTDLLNRILDIIIKIGWILAFFFLIYAGFLFVTAAGSEEQIKKAKATFMWTVIGSAIVLGAKALAIIVETTVKEVVGK